MWRLNVEDKENQDSWTKLDANLTDLTYIDRKFNQLPQGSYQYAVQAVYADGKMSDIGYSEEIEHLMSTDVTIIVTTSTAVDMSKGAVITLENADKPEYTYTKVAEGHKTVFKGIRKGMYNMTVIRDGFNRLRLHGHLQEIQVRWNLNWTSFLKVRLMQKLYKMKIRQM